MMTSTQADTAKTKTEEILWYYKKRTIVLAILCFGPLGLVLLWFRPKTGLYLKILVSIFVIALAVWMTKGATIYYEKMVLHYEELAEIMKSS